MTHPDALSPQQRQLCSHGGSWARTSALVQIEGELEPQRLRLALLGVLNCYEHLRTMAISGEAKPENRENLDAASSLAWRYLAEFQGKWDLDALPRDGRLHVCLIRTKPQSFRLYLALPAMLCDARGLAVMVAQMVRFYELGAECADTDGPAYAQVGELLNLMLSSEDTADGRDYWKRRDFPGLGQVPYPFKMGSTSIPFAPKSFPVANYVATIDNSTPPEDREVFWLSCWLLFLWRHEGGEALVTTRAFDGRTFPEVAAMPGLFSRYLPLSIDLERATHFQELQSQIRQAITEHEAYQDYFSWDWLHHGLPRPPIHAPFAFAYHDAGQICGAGDTRFSIQALDSYWDRFGLQLTCVRLADRLVLRLDYDANLYADDFVKILAERWAVMVEDVRAHPLEPLRTHRLMSTDERNLVTEHGAGPTFDFPGPAFPVLFENRVLQTPDRVAVARGENHLTYEVLDIHAGMLARTLSQTGTGRETVAAVLADRGLAYLQAILATFKAGAAFLPLDPNHPPERHRQILEQSAAPLLLCTHRLSQMAENLAGVPTLNQVLAIRGTAISGPRLTTGHIFPDQTAYVIFTSGSTGRPKGAVVRHAGMLNHLNAKCRDLNLAAADVVAQNASQCFDISVWQYLAVLMAGGRVQVIVNATAHDPVRLLSALPRYAITQLEVVPALLRMMLEALNHPDFPRPDLARLRHVIPTGEALPTDICNRWFRLFPGIPLLNAYGPTECSDDVTHFWMNEPTKTERVPIGRPIAHTRLWVLDPCLALLPPEAAGELHVAGVCQGRGYLGEPSRTAAVFIPNSFADEPGSRLYRTGDRARLLADGNFEFLGRLDSQVKLLGFRMELGEIETVLKQHPAVEQAIVTLHETTEDKRLAAYVVGHGKTAPANADLETFLRRRLPEPMVPAVFVPLDTLPLSRNGKLDRAALPDPRAFVLGETTYTAPRDATEAKLAKIWSDVLKRERVGIHDDFFALGGHSLSGTMLVYLLNQAFGVDLLLADVFERPTIAGLGEKILETRVADADPEDVAALLGELSQLTEEELERLLEEEREKI